MILNPLFLQINTINNVNENQKQTKPNSPSYLFSDIIRLLNDSSPDQNVTASNEAAPGQVKNDLSFPLLNNSLTGDGSTKSADQQESINPIDEPVIESEQTIKSEEVNLSDSLNLIPAKIDLAASLKQIFKGVTENEIDLKNLEPLNNSNTIPIVENEKENNGINAKVNLVNPLNNNEILALNFNLLSSAALNFNDKGQLLTKVFNSESLQDKLPQTPLTLDKKSLNKEIEKIASLLIGLLTQQNNSPGGDIAGQKTLSSETVKTIGIQNISPPDANLKDSIFSQLNSNEPVVLNINLGGEKLKVEISVEADKNANKKIQTLDVLPETEVLPSSDKISSQEVKNLLKKNSLKTVLPDTNEKTRKKIDMDKPAEAKLGEINSDVKPEAEPEVKFEIKPEVNSEIKTEVKSGIKAKVNSEIKTEIKSGTKTKINSGIKADLESKINSEVKTEKLNAGVPKKIILKITRETGDESSQSVNILKEKLQDLVGKEKVEIKVLTTEIKQTIKTEKQQAGDLLPKDKNVIVKTNNTVPATNQTTQNVDNPQKISVNEIQKVVDNVTGDLAATVDNFLGKSPELKKEVNKTGINSNNNTSDTSIRQAAANISNTPDKEPEQKSSSDKKETPDLRSTELQTHTSNTELVNNEAPKNIFKMLGENNVTVKTSNLINEMSRFFMQGKSKNVVIKLKPETLGNVKIVLDVVDKVVRANIQVDNEFVKQIVQNNINKLVQTLNLSGLHLSSFNVSLNNNESKESKTNSQKKKSSNVRFEDKVSKDNEPIISKSMGYNTYDFII